MTTSIKQCFLVILCLCGIHSTMVFGQNDVKQDSVKSFLMDDIVVTALRTNRLLNAPEMGHFTLSGNIIQRMPVILGEPDVIKTLALLPGVSQGVEGFASMYVRGGNNDQNLFLIQGLPIYHVSHLGGLFSSFNTAIISDVDFYKSSFPSAFGGRLSSITDIHIKQPEWQKLKGKLTIGLLSGNLYFSTPIIKDRVALSVCIRRSWADAITVPAMAIVNATQKTKGKSNQINYAFFDANIRLNVKFTPNINGYIIGYWGNDKLKLGEKTFNRETDKQREMATNDQNILSWGNNGVLGAMELSKNYWIHNVSLYYTGYKSLFEQKQSTLEDVQNMLYERMTNSLRNSIRDVGLKFSTIYCPNEIYRLKMGVGYVNHSFTPDDVRFYRETDSIQSKQDSDPIQIPSTEYYAYIDNRVALGARFSINVGGRLQDYRLSSNHHIHFEPRLSVKFSINETTSIKADYTKVSQIVQQVPGNYISLPTDSWLPISDKFTPLSCSQYSMGLYRSLSKNTFISLEGWYKNMNNLLEYKEGVSVLNDKLNWDQKLTQGKGWSYGLDFSIETTRGRWTAEVHYGLLWNWRKFKELNQGEKFPAKFDNRHKLNMIVNYKINPSVELNANWTYISGNRMTLSLFNYDGTVSAFPQAPIGGESMGNSQWNSLTGIDYIGSVNNIRMPAYHRLDMGMEIFQNLKNGRKGIWNISLYNAYCRMNTLMIQKHDYTDYTKRRSFKSLSLLPIIPSISYTYEF